MAMAQQSRYVIETNIQRFKEHLRSGLLDEEQTRTVTALLAEAYEELDEFDRRDAIAGRPTVAEGVISTAAHSS